MEKPVEIIWHDLAPAPHVEERIGQRVTRLEKIFDRIIGCHVVIEAPHRHHRRGNQYEVRVVVTVPGGELTVNRRPGDDNAHFDLLVAIRDAFDAMERKLREWKERHKGRPPRAGEGPVRGHILSIDREAGTGAVSGPGGIEIRFDRAALTGEDFDTLAVGQPVNYVVDPASAPDAPYASSLWRVEV